MPCCDKIGGGGPSLSVAGGPLFAAADSADTMPEPTRPALGMVVFIVGLILFWLFRPVKPGQEL